MKIAVIGTGLIGCERISALQDIAKSKSDIKISAIYDPCENILNDVSKKFMVPSFKSLDDALLTKPDWVFIATPNNVVKDIAKNSFDIGANVLVEKPCGRSLKECDDIISIKPDNCKLNVGFNYRFFSGIESIMKDIKSGKFGDIISVNLILGHGNSPGMEKSWKLDPIQCGDCVTDLGVHLLDLILQISENDVNINYVKSWSGFWNTGVKEETHWVATNKNGTIFNAQVSYNRWKSTFRLEVHGTEGYGIVENRGRSYGLQSYRYGYRWGWLSGKPQIDTENYVIKNYDCSDSFYKETISILNLEGSELLPKACSHVGARNIMVLLSKLEEKQKEI